MVLKPEILRFGTLVVVVAALGLGACGSEDEGDGPSKADYVATANSLCAMFNLRTEALGREILQGDDPSVAEMQAFVRRTAPLVEENLKRLRALEAPAADRARVDEIYDTAERELRAFARAATDRDAARDLLADFDPFERANRLARDYGLGECAG